MARATAGLTPRQAALLLRCQQVREARMRGEAARCAAGHAAASQQVEAARAAADGHAAAAAAASRRGYDGLIGRGSGILAIDALRAREVTSQRTQAQLAEAAAAAGEEEAQAAALETAARERLAEAAYGVARRERLLDAASRDWARVRAARDEAKAEDGHAALHAWRG